MKLIIKPHEKVRAEMILQGYTQEAMCEATGMSWSAFNLKINGHREFSLGECKLIVKVLGKTLDDLFYDVDVPKREQDKVI